MLNIGFDDTDSPQGMCTTFLAFKIVDSLKKEKVEFLDYPHLIRFNPNIPWKTRGNGAVAIKIRTSNPSKIKKKVKTLVKKFSDTKNGANPGLVFYQNEVIPKNLKEFSKLALWQLVHRHEAKKFVLDSELETFFIGNGQGLVGAVGAIGYEFDDHTMELLSYRKSSRFGKKRKISSPSIIQMQDKTFPHTFNSYDDKKKKVLIVPRGPDPVFYGIRGEDPNSLFRASKMLITEEKLEGHLLFRSNQGTSAHLKNKINVNQLRPYSSGNITGYVSKRPQMEKGGHVFFTIDVDGTLVNCAVYKPTGLAPTALNLIEGDKVKVGGGVRKASKKHSRIINLEFLEVLKLKRNIIMENPLCIKCIKKMKSKGRAQGFECIKCGEQSNSKIKKTIPRKISVGLYLPVVSAHRHLTRPKQRLGVINKDQNFDDSLPWILKYN